MIRYEISIPGDLRNKLRKQIIFSNFILLYDINFLLILNTCEKLNNFKIPIGEQIDVVLTIIAVYRTRHAAL